MKAFIKFIAAAGIVSALQGQPVQSAQITGNIGFSGEVMFDTASPATATTVTSWSGTMVINDSDAFAMFVPSFSFAPFTSSLWSFNSTTPITGFWQAGGFSFNVVSSKIISQGGSPGTSGFVTATATGLVSGNGYASTPFTWTFTCSDPPAGVNPSIWTFSASGSPVSVAPAPVLQTRTITNGLVLSWSDSSYALQSATNLGGPFTAVSSAVSPFTNRFTGPQQFFRLSK